MNYLVITGNGFDLAHKLETSYYHFINKVIKERITSNKYVDLIKVLNHDNPDIIIQNPLKTVSTNNILFQNLLLDASKKNWCDIEKTYFNFLYKNKYGDINRLNQDFDIIKKHLEEYLVNEQDRLNTIECYNKLFEELEKNKTTVLNFNYTNTLNKYKLKNTQLINIHGELKSELNPIIFGYSAREIQMEELREKDENEYVINIKRNSYKLTDNETRLNLFLDSHNDIIVLLLGHSIGSSDRRILNTIFNHKHVSFISIFYHETSKHYKDILINIERVSEGPQNNDKILNFPESIRMPQYNDANDQQRAFLNKFQKSIQEIKLKIKPKYLLSATRSK